jgi:hypothetical protein
MNNLEAFAKRVLFYVSTIVRNDEGEISFDWTKEDYTKLIMIKKTLLKKISIQHGDKYMLIFNKLEELIKNDNDFMNFLTNFLTFFFTKNIEENELRVFFEEIKEYIPLKMGKKKSSRNSRSVNKNRTRRLYGGSIDSTDNICCICLDTLSNGETILLHEGTPNHKIHLECFNVLINNNIQRPMCPYCRGPITYNRLNEEPINYLTSIDFFVKLNICLICFILIYGIDRLP